MPLSPGTRLGPFEVLAPLGAGGMGEAYRARDTRLNRTVALKVLSPELSTDPEFKARFAREARTISGLNHPHICVLHDIGTDIGTDYLVLEYLDGVTLAERLAREPRGLKLADSLRIAIAIADALDAGSRAGLKAGAGDYLIAREPAPALTKPATSLDRLQRERVRTLGSPRRDVPRIHCKAPGIEREWCAAGLEA